MTVDTPIISVSAVVIRNDDGDVLTVRKRGTSRFMFPGGKPEPGETALEAVVRETREELGVDLNPQGLRPLGVFVAAAANEAQTLVRATVFTYPLPVDVDDPAAEIDELRWQPIDDGSLTATPDLAPLLTDAVFPALTR